MSAVRFRLQSVLDVRANALQEAQGALATALADRGAAQSDCDRARMEAEANAQGICASTAPQPASLLQAAREAFLFQARVVHSLEARIQECDQVVQQRRLQVVKASRDHEILVRLRTKWMKRRQAEEDRKSETALGDLMNAQRFQSLRQFPEEFLQV
jgi:flagellar export protein FliJ